MKYKLLLILTMGFLSSLFSCKSKKVNNRASNSSQNNLLVQIDKAKKTVRQNIFNEITEFSYEDFENLKSNKSYDQFEIGQLKVVSGEIVCTDPLLRKDAFPQNWKVAIGDYPVNIYIGLEEDFEGRVAYAEITFTNEKIVSWELSLIPDHHLENDFGRKMNGMYGVDAGLSSFCDFETWKKYDNIVDKHHLVESANFYDDILAPLFELNDGTPKSSRGQDWVNYNIGDENIIMFGSGWGDGLYPRYIAFDENRNPVKFITDFILIAEMNE